MDDKHSLISLDEKDLGKMYYTIGEVAQMLKVSPSLIRFWETEFQSLKPKKSKKGNRLFTKDDIAQLQMIYHLVKEKGFTLEGARNQLKGGKGDLERKIKVTEKLKNLRAFLSDLKSQL